MTMVQGLRSRVSLGSLKSETKLTLLLFLVSFFISGMPRVYTQTAAHTLFLDLYGSAALPYAYFAEALFVPFMGWLFMFAERRLPIRSLLLAALLLDVVVQIAFRVCIGLGVPFSAAGTIVWFEVEFVLSSLVLWGLANHMMTLRQGKRLFGFVSAGEPLAIIVCGLTTPMLLKFLRPEDLFLFSALGAGIGIALILAITSRFEPAGGAHEEEEAGQGEEAASVTGEQPWYKSRYVQVMVVTLIISQLCYFFIDNAFYMEASARYPEEQQLGGFLGVYSAVMGTISLVCSVLLAGPIVRRFGVRGGLLTLPLLLTLGAGATVIVGHLGGGSEILFLMIVGNKVIDQAFRYTLDKTTGVTLYQPLPARQRTQVQAALESIIEPLSGGMSGLILFGAIEWLGFGAFHITHLILAIALGWFGMVFVQHRGYLAALKSALKGRALIGGEMSFDNDEAIAYLKAGLNSQRPGEVIYSLRMLETTRWLAEPADVAALLAHPAMDVRLDAAHRVESGALPASIEMIERRLAEEASPTVRGALLEALSAGHLEDLVAAMLPYLDGHEPEVRLSAFVGLIRHGGIEGIVEVGGRLLTAEKSAAAEDRCFAAQVIEKVASPQLYRPLLSLLADPDARVRKAALAAAKQVKMPRLWPLIFDNLKIHGMDKPAMAAMAAIGAPLIPAARDFALSARANDRARQAVIAVFGQIGTEEAMADLVAHIGHADRRLHRAALLALWRRKHRLAEAERPRLVDALSAELVEARVLLNAWLDCHGEGGEMILAALDRELALVEDDLFTLLALVLPENDLHEARAFYRAGDPVRRAFVIEMLDNALDREIKADLLPFLEAETTAERAAKMLSIDRETLSFNERMVRFASEPEGRLLDWTRACALYAADPETLPASAIEAAIASDNPAARTVAQWLRDGRPTYGKDRSMLLTIEKVLALRGVAIFSEIKEEYLTHIAVSLAEERLGAGEVLFSQGEFGTALYVIYSGKLRVHSGDRVLAELGDREVVGEMAALDPEPRSATVTAMEDCILLKITNDDLDMLLSDDVEVARGIIHVLVNRLRNKAGKQPAKPVAEKVA
jgi:HEAT repeat protein